MDRLCAQVEPPDRTEATLLTIREELSLPRSARPASPLPQRHGLDAVRLLHARRPALVHHARAPRRTPGHRVGLAGIDAMLAERRDRRADGPDRPRRRLRAGHVPVVPPRSAGRGAGAVRDRRRAPRRAHGGRRQAALPGDDPARPARRRDGAGPAARRPRPARPLPRAPARPRHRGPADVRRAAAGTAAPTRRCSATAASRRPTRRSRRTTRGSSCRARSAAGSSRSAG